MEVEKFKILVLDQNKSDLNKTLNKLNKAFEKNSQIYKAETLDEFKQQIEKEKFDFFISEIPDISDDNSKNEKSLKQIIKLSQKKPLLILTKYDDEALAKKSIKLGAQDYILKGKGNEKTLKRIIEYSIERGKYLAEIDKMKEEVERNNKNLEAIVADRTKDLEQANKAKTIFFANVTHELRTPLHAIINLSQFGAEKINSADREKLLSYYENIYKSGTRLLSLVDDILDFTKAQMSNLNIRFKKYSLLDFVDFVNNTAKELLPIIGSNNNILEIINNSTHKFVFLDETRVKQILTNLLSNAVKYGGENTKIMVKISDYKLHPRHEVSPEGVSVSVIDEGEGINQDELETIFDEFAQSQKKIRTGGYSKGTGLGLAIAKQFAMAHNGRIWAENNKNKKGATVTFTIPVNKKDLPEY